MKVRFFSSIAIAAFCSAFLAQAAFGAVAVSTVPFDPCPSGPSNCVLTNPHSTYVAPGGTESLIVLGATVPSAVGSTDSFTFQWNFGDSTSSPVTSLTNPYDISVTHQYPSSAAPGTAWTAVVTVKDTTSGATGTANYYVAQGCGPTPTTTCTVNNIVAARANAAIDWGLWYMHQTMWRGTTTVSGSTVNWGGWDQNGAGTCPTVNGNAWDCTYYGVIDAENTQALEVNGHLQAGPASDPFTDDVARGLARMFTFLATQTAQTDTYTYNPATANYTCKDGSVPSTSDPLCTTHGGQYFYNPSATSCPAPNCVFTFDGNKNNTQSYSNDGSGEYTYTTSPFIEAMTAADTPTAKAPTGPTGVQGQTFQNIVQDLEDFYNYSQYGSDYDVSQGYTRGASQYQGGAWLYGPQQGDDNSTSQWAAIGLIAGFRALGISVPSIVTDTNNAWVTNAQDLTQPAPTGTDPFGAGDDLGAYGYRGSWAYSQEWGPFAMTPSAMVQMALDGVGRTQNTVFGDPTTAVDQRWNNSESFYADNFCNDVYTYGSGGYDDAYYAPRAYMYGMFSFTKSMLLHDPSFGLSPITYLRTLTPNVFPGDPTYNPPVPTNQIDWYNALSSTNDGTDPCDGVAQTLVTFQTSPADGVFDGHWYGNTADVGYYAQSPYETAWALIMLKGTVFVGCINNLAGTGSASGAAPARVDLTWTNQANTTSYDVFRGTASGGPYTLLGNTTSTAFSDTKSLVNGDTYYYVVQPLSGSTEICQSNQATVKVPVPSGRH